ncbi:hypothetical protein H310_14689 [Aphanomyces invadans]|uniref:Uncharacterized protein n=1 Tax=Aphanomyces invadans TaxID=157072 RepID=A0A024T995_9STRA|nr:hypothetical protein H310_14689 [Aphanomyces invadans]ETV90564.1 hypothetical protein H310_14689 [Aphanomyces invadans]|eukprot:XP_008880814.1 hypothetical protein H310_14689 [Aphanomyces invadans]
MAAPPTLLLRDEIVSTVASITSSDYNFRDHELVVTNGAVLQVYTGLASDEVQLRHTWHAQGGEAFVRVVYVEWTNAFVVFCVVGPALHRRLLQLGAVGYAFDDLGVLCHEGTLLDVAMNHNVHELVTTDSVGGIRMWSIRSASVSGDAARRGGVLSNGSGLHDAVGNQGGTTGGTASSPPKKLEWHRCPTRLHVQDAKNTTWHVLCVDTQHQRIVAASSCAIKVFDALSGAVLAKCRHATRAPAPHVRQLVYVPHVHHVLAIGPRGVDVWDVSSLKLDPTYMDVHPYQNAHERVDGGGADDVMSCCLTHTPSAYATKPGLAAVVILTASSKVMVVPCGELDRHAIIPPLSFQLKSLQLPMDAVADAWAMPPPSLAPPTRDGTAGFVFANAQYSARDFVILVQTHPDGSCIRVVEVLSARSTSRMLTSSSKLFSLREISFTLPSPPQRGHVPRRGYSLFGGTAVAKSVQLFEDVALPVCQLALPRHEGVDYHGLDTNGAAPDPVLCFLEYSAYLAKVIVGWSDGVLDLFSLNGQRWRLLKRPSGVMADCVGTVQLPNAVVALVAGDADGLLDTWFIEPHASTFCGSIAAHSEPIVSIQVPAALSYPDSDSNESGIAPRSPASQATPCRPCMVTTAFDGQIKVWEWMVEAPISAVDGTHMDTTRWRLAGLFKTHSIHVSVAKLVNGSHLCCGCETGAVELWALPRRSSKGATSLGTSKKAVLFCPAAHCSAVSDVAVYRSDGSTGDPDFTLVATMARDHTILFWYFVGDICVPFRRSLLSANPCGGYFSTAATPNALSFLCCVGTGVDRVLVLPRLQRQILALVVEAANHHLLRPPPDPSSPGTICNEEGYPPMDIPVQLTMPTVHMHVMPSDEVAEAVARLSPGSPQRHHQSHPPTRHSTFVNLSHEQDVLAVPMHMSESTPATPSDGSGHPNGMAAQVDSPPPGWALHGQYIRRKSTPLQMTVVPRAYRDISKRTNAPRVYRQPPPSTRNVREVRPLRAGIVSAFGILSSSEDDQHNVPSPPRLQQRRHAVLAPKASGGVADKGADYSAKMAKNVHVVELATRPASNPRAPLFWLDAHGDRPSTSQTGAADVNSSQGPHHDAANEFDVDSLFIPWDDLSPAQQFVEIQASLMTTAVRHLCADAGLDLPPSCFDLDMPSNVPDKVLYHKYTFWYARKSPQARSTFLRQELLFATEDPHVVESALSHGIAIPKRTDRDSVNSSSPMFYRWCRYVAWYCRGFVLQHHHLDALGAVDFSATPHYSQRLVDRTVLLQNRLREVDVALQSFAKLQAKEIAKQQTILNAAAIMLNKLNKATAVKPVLPPELRSLDVDFFKAIALPNGQAVDFVPWESLTLMEQQKELAVAMHDGVVRWQAMKAHISMPHLASAIVSDDVDEIQLTNQCAAFITWWSTPHNAARIQFLKAEAHEAAKNASVQAAASQAGVDLAFHDAIRMFTHRHHEPSPSPSSAYHDWYFGVTHAAESARVAFLKQKMMMLQRQKRFELVLELGRLPPPVLYVMTPTPLISHDTDIVPAVAAVEVELGADDGVAGEGGVHASAQSPTAVGVDADALEREKALREQWEAAQLVWNRRQMESEDDAARVMRLMDDDDVGDDEAPSPRERPERDYTISYFFNTMPGPREAAAVAATGWASGCGLDNGDEEVEEREIREAERLRQLELDALDRARIAEEERVAALLLAEQLREDERKAQKRARQVEVKRILTWQRDEAMRREAEASQKRMELDSAAMAHEEIHSRQAWLQLEQARQHMATMDLESAEWAKQRQEQQQQRVARLASDRRNMLREDGRSRDAAEYADEAARQAADKEAFLRELYTPFDPFFPDTDCRRCLRTSSSTMRPTAGHDHRRPMTQHAASKLVSGHYAVPFYSAIELSSPETEVYQAQPSQKFQALLGLSVQYRRPPTSHSQNVAASLETLSRARSVPGLPRPHSMGDVPIPFVGSSRRPPSRSSRPRTQPFAAAFPSDSIDSVPSRRSKKHRRRILAEATQLTPLSPHLSLHNNQQESAPPTHTRTITRLRQPVQDQAAMYRQLSVPPPFFRGNMAVVGQKPTTAPSANGGSCKTNDTTTAAPLLVIVPHGTPLSATQPRIIDPPTTRHSEDYGFGRPDHDDKQ